MKVVNPFTKHRGFAQTIVAFFPFYILIIMKQVMLSSTPIQVTSNDFKTADKAAVVFTYWRCESPVYYQTLDYHIHTTEKEYWKQ